uniref:Zinc finger ZPR1-type domain-containing protein n=1 Tax=Salix viminalis TaxID=40686 RepID=A0A6N2N8V1_SALVM
MEGRDNKEQIVDVGSVVEAISTADNNDTGVPLYQVESLCMRCGENGITNFLLTLIPHFRKILLSAFECPHCGERNNEVQFAGEIQPRGCCYSLDIPSGDQKMLNRQVVKSESATIKIPELDFEIPPEAQRGSLSTIEGILARAADELQALQEERRKVDPKTAEAIDEFLLKLRACAAGDSSFKLILDDPAGNSFIENLFAPSPDPSMNIKFYERTPEQQATLGYQFGQSQMGEPSDGPSSEVANNVSDQTRREPHGSIGAAAGHRAIAQSNSAEIADALFRYSAPEEVMTFPTTCGSCSSSCETRMFVTNIPYFQEVIVMASTCDACGYRNSELKPGGRIPEKGKAITLCVKNANDLSRDVIKSDTAGVKVPELDLELGSGTLGGLVTTVEGLITKISESLERVHGFTFGDSLEESKKSKWQGFEIRLKKLVNVEEPWTLILDDALANSFIAPATDDIKDDHQLSFEEYERSWEQNEELGLNDIDTSSADAAYDSTQTTIKEKTTE